jgi:hypothetical protein
VTAGSAWLHASSTSARPPATRVRSPSSAPAACASAPKPSRAPFALGAPHADVVVARQRYIAIFSSWVGSTPTSQTGPLKPSRTGGP